MVSYGDKTAMKRKQEAFKVIKEAFIAKKKAEEEERRRIEEEKQR